MAVIGTYLNVILIWVPAWPFIGFHSPESITIDDRMSHMKQRNACDGQKYVNFEPSEDFTPKQGQLSVRGRVVDSVVQDSSNVFEVPRI